MFLFQPKPEPSNDDIATLKACEQLARRLDTSLAVIRLASDIVGRDAKAVEAYLRSNRRRPVQRQ